LHVSRFTLHVSRFTHGVAALLLTLLFLVGTAVAQTAVTDDQVNEVAKELYCPVCENTPLDVCHTQACADWRAVIRTQLSEGRTRQEIFDYFAAQYGNQVLATPPRRGLNWLLWLWPALALVVGGFFFARYLRTLRVAADATPPLPRAPQTAVTPSRPSPLPDDYLARIERELEERS
jgi:cytochrome c-type biogenesis protein CcmH